MSRGAIKVAEPSFELLPDQSRRLEIISCIHGNLKTLSLTSQTETQLSKPVLGSLKIWSLPSEESLLEEFLTYVFTNYWDRVVFGPIIEGAAYELTRPSAPTTCRLIDGYLTISFGGPHFHLCVGENNGPPRDPTPEDLKQRRKPSKAQIFRRLDKDGASPSWGFKMWNGQREPMILFFFANPFLEAGDRSSKEPE